MHMELKTPPAAHPVTLEDAKSHLRVDGGDEDAYIADLIAKATRAAEQHCDRAFVAQTWVVSLDAFPSLGKMIALPMPPLMSVKSVTYIDTDGAEQTLAPANYQASKRSPAVIAPAPGKSWPTTQAGRLDAVGIEIEVGYGDAAAVPAPIHHAILLLVAHWYENREPVNVGNIINNMPFTVDALLAPYRVWSLA